MRKNARQAAASAAEQVIERSPAIEDVINLVAPRAQHAKQIIVPAIRDARGRLVPLVNDVVDRVSRAVHDAYAKASDRVQHDVYPKLQEWWDEAQENPTVAEASTRGRSALAALKGDLLLPEPKRARKQRHVFRKILTALGLAALIGAIIVAVRSVLGSSDDGWSPAEPMRPAREESDAEWGDNPFQDTGTEADAGTDPDSGIAVEPDVTTTAADSLEEAEERMVGEGGPQITSLDRYGDGAYIGTEPPEGYAIKGNERSMKYHTADAAGYERTNADVWFISEEAAQAAGFTRASR